MSHNHSDPKDSVGKETTNNSFDENSNFLPEKHSKNHEKTFLKKSERSVNLDTTQLPVPVEYSDQNELKPIRIRLYRNNETRVESYQFMPKDNLRLDVLGTGVSRATEVIMRDIEGKIRFRARSGGMDHVFKTRVQFTRSFGKWKLEIIYPDNLENIQSETIEIEIAKDLPPVIVPEHLRVKEIDGEEYSKDHVEEQEILENESIGDTVEDKNEGGEIQIQDKSVEVTPTIEVLNFWQKIPITEIELIEPIFRTKLFHNQIKTLGEFLNYTAENISDQTSAPIEKVVQWFEEINKLKEDKEHRLHKIYIQLHEEEIEYTQKLDELLKTEIVKEPVSNVKFVGVKSEEKLNSIGIYTISDLILYDADKIDNKTIQKSLFARWVKNAHDYIGLEPFNWKVRLVELKKIIKTS